MGNSPSSISALGLDSLAAIAGSQPILLDDPAWKSLLAFPTPLVQFDPAEVHAHIRPQTGSLVYHNSQTLNCQRLLYLLSQQLSQVPPSSAGIATANFVHVVALILQDLIEGLNATQLLSFIELPSTVFDDKDIQKEFSSLFGPTPSPPSPPAPNPPPPSSLLHSLVTAALRALDPLSSSKTKPGSSHSTPGSYLYQTEVIHLLLVLSSTQLSHDFAGSPGWANRTNPPPPLHRLCGPPPALSFYTPPQPRSALYFVKAAASTVLWLPYTAYALLRRGSASQSVPASPGESPLADAAVSLLLTLFFYPRAPSSDGNGNGRSEENYIRRALRNLQDADDITSDSAVEAAEGGVGGGGATATSTAAAVPYPALFTALGHSLLLRESSVLLLYSLLHGTPHFVEYCLARSDIDTLLLPILELLYTARGRSANQLYMLLIVLLILSQEPSFASNVHRIRLRSVSFYKDRHVMDTTLGSLLVVLLLRTAHYNLASLRDVYLHTNTLATLANLAPSMTNISSHTAQRLVGLLQLLHRRHTRLMAAEYSTTEDNESEVEKEQRALELQLYADFIRIVLEIINAILVNALPANPELVYTLLHRREVFTPFEQDPKYADLMENIVLVTDHFGRKVESVFLKGGDGLPGGSDGSGANSSSSNLSVSAENVLAVIKTSVMGWRKDKLRTFPELKFTYEEEASPEDFFVPYIWSLILSTLPMQFTLSSITAFVPMVAPSPTTTTTTTAAASPAPHSTAVGIGVTSPSHGDRDADVGV